MLKQIRQKIGSKDFRSYFSLGAIGVYVIAIVSLSVAWAGTKAIQRNYRLLKEVSVLEQQAAIAEQRVENQKLLNEYYKSDAFLELAAKRQFNKANPGEKLLIVPKSIAREKLPAGATDEAETSEQKITTELTGWQAWLQFLTGRGFDD